MLKFRIKLGSVAPATGTALDDTGLLFGQFQQAAGGFMGEVSHETDHNRIRFAVWIGIFRVPAGNLRPLLKRGASFSK
jgi:hypothetical protein